MKRLGILSVAWKAVAVAFLLMSSSVVIAQGNGPAAAPSEDEIMSNLEVQNAANDLFRASQGVPHRVRAMWVIYENGEYRVVPWPPSHGYYKETWNGPLPQFVVAIIHTVPLSRPPEPSVEDQELANGKQLAGLSLTVYTLHHFGISKVVPGGSKPVQVRGPGWISEFTQGSKELMVQRAQAKTQRAQVGTR